jgi:membrane protease YdiL (CAAX protease family)
MRLEVDMVAAEGECAFVRSDAEVRLRARQGLAIYFGMVVLLSAVFQVLFVQTRSLIWVVPLMWSPAVASVVARLALREGFADVSFRVGGRRGWQAIAVAAIFPIAIGLPVYGIAWKAGLASFAPRPRGVAAHLASTSPVASFVVMLAVAATIGTIVASLTAAGEEIGWRGYMLTRLIDAGIPHPILLSGLIWGLWHVPIVLGAGYAAGPSPAASALLLVVLATAFGVVFARLRLQTGSIWPAIALHGAWNSIIQSAFDAARTGGDSSRLHDGASWWVGESGVLTVIAMIIAAVVISQRRWAIPRQLNVRPATGVASSTDQPQSTGPTACVHDRGLIPRRPVRWRARCRHFFLMLGRIVWDRTRYRLAM